MSDKGKQIAVGIDLGGTAVKIGLVDASYEVLAQTSIPTNGERPYEQVIADMGNTAAALLEENGYTVADCLGAGVGSPGIIDS
ncbi:MAG: ROK family protein [Lachnospiraceae bacterium]|nr:ROK family protein [Lachnospiraceae bacterium]